MRWIKNLKVNDEVYTKYETNLHIGSVKEIHNDYIVVKRDYGWATRDIEFSKTAGLSINYELELILIRKNKRSDKTYQKQLAKTRFGKTRDQNLKINDVCGEHVALQKLGELGLHPSSYIVSRVEGLNGWVPVSVNFMCGDMNVAVLIIDLRVLTVFSQPRPYGLPVPHEYREFKTKRTNLHESCN